jgi:23S rRNA U2552 (ribose-2'-O)-methylase RlmE/FtsJ
MIFKLREIYNKTATHSFGLGDKGTLHSYIDEYYENAFRPFRATANRVMEIGINRGHSMLMWREYFLTAEIVGVDIADYGIRDPNVTLIYGDATKPETFESLGDAPFDIIIDDGSHQLAHQLKSFEILFPRLREGGLYVIEDIQDLAKEEAAFKALHPSYTLFDMRPLLNRYDDIIIQYTK